MEKPKFVIHYDDADGVRTFYYAADRQAVLVNVANLASTGAHNILCYQLVETPTVPDP